MESRIYSGFKSLNKINFILAALAVGLFIWSAINPCDYFVWFLETCPIMIAVPLMIFTRRNFPLSNLLYGIIFIHIIVLSVGGHYTYAEVPFFNYLRDTFHLSRNEYDKIGHFMQGLTPAFLTYEIIIRKTPIKERWLIILFCISVPLAFSALYEIFEWIMNLFSSSGEDFAGMQGDIWDAQKDMLVALIGASLVIFRKKRDV